MTRARQSCRIAGLDGAAPHLLVSMHSRAGNRDRNEEAAAAIPLAGGAGRGVGGAWVSGTTAAAFPTAPGVALVVLRGIGGGATGDLACADLLGALGDRLGEGPPGDRGARRAWLVDVVRHGAVRLRQTPASRGPRGAALALALVVGDEVEVASVGDVRVWLYRDGELSCLTADHGLRAVALARGVSEAEVAVLPDVLVRCLGLADEVEPPDLASLTLAPDDALLLASRGVARALGELPLRRGVERLKREPGAIDLVASEAEDEGAEGGLTLLFATPVDAPPEDARLRPARFPELLLDDVTWELGGPPFATAEGLVAAVQEHHVRLRAAARWVDRWRTERAACLTPSPDSVQRQVCSWHPEALFTPWPPERVALWAPRAVVRFSRGGGEAELVLEAEDGRRFTVAELLLKLHNGLAGGLAEGDARVFEGLRLEGETEGASPSPVYGLLLAADVRRVGVPPL